VISPGLFLSWTPAQVTGLNGSTGQQLGGLLTGWNLFDSNGNPIALSTLSTLVGTAGPQKDTAGNLLPAISPYFWNNAKLVPVEKNSPMVAFNGGWFYLNQPVGNAQATWADAFFNWGMGTAGYSTYNLVPGKATVPIPGGSSTSWAIDYSAATTAPPSVNVSGGTIAQSKANSAITAARNKSNSGSKKNATFGKLHPNGKLRPISAGQYSQSLI
jgi:hypothetical protein